ncbi:MAG: ABC transporter substrate-binding protein [Bauldia sp.]|nr:ABC transporter substrate-binding protein [Bauldia sp.]
MRKLAYALLGAAVLAVPAMAQNITVGTTAIVEHPALDAVRDGVLAALEEEGFRNGQEIRFLYESAQGQPSIAAQIAAQFVGENVNVIVPIATPSAQAAVAATTTIPVVFAAVTDPLDAGLITDVAHPGGNVTGVSDLTPVADQFALAMEIVPDMDAIGVIYNPAEANAVVLVNLLKAAASEAGVTVVEATAANSGAVQAAAASLVGRVDAIYVPTDNTVVSALDAVIGVAEEAKIPLFSGDNDSVREGTVASIGFDYYEHGKQAGRIVARILRGENPGDIAVEYATGGVIAVNPAAAERMGITIPQAVLDRAGEVVPAA